MQNFFFFKGDTHKHLHIHMIKKKSVKRKLELEITNKKSNFYVCMK